MTDDTTWRYYLPERGERPEDAIEFRPSNLSFIASEDIAESAMTAHYDNGGWENFDEEVTIVVIAPDGTETRWRGWNEAVVEHHVERLEGEGKT